MRLKKVRELHTEYREHLKAELRKVRDGKKNGGDVPDEEKVREEIRMMQQLDSHHFIEWLEKRPFVCDEENPKRLAMLQKMQKSMWQHEIAAYRLKKLEELCKKQREATLGMSNAFDNFDAEQIEALYEESKALSVQEAELIAKMQQSEPLGNAVQTDSTSSPVNRPCS